MAIKMVREPSETPNINNIDDIVPMRYAYGNQNGYVIGKGTEISNTVNGLNFTVNSGRLVLQGVECDIDASGVTITIDNIATKRYYVVYLQVNLGLNTAQILSTYDTATYPTVDDGDDLTENNTGIARLPLYRFIATNGVISEVNKVIESIKYINPSITVDNSKKVNNLEIKQDENGVLKIGDVIIPQKILLWEGNEAADIFSPVSITINNLAIGDTIEVEWENSITVSSSVSGTIRTSSIGTIANDVFIISFPLVVYSGFSTGDNIKSAVALNMKYTGNGVLECYGAYGSTSSGGVMDGLPAIIKKLYKIIQ